MTPVANLPPNISKDDRVILFDGVCKVCNAWSNFIIQHDSEHKFKLCSVQSDEGIQILAHFGFPTDFYETMLYVEGGECFQRSDSFFNVVSQLGYPWKIAYILKMFPKTIRDWGYNRIALNRYKLFGKYDYCTLPTADHESRYLSAK
jgi:predicted DCC family thiol-disulfide oxidoreductase YuxK